LDPATHDGFGHAEPSGLAVDLYAYGYVPTRHESRGAESEFIVGILLSALLQSLSIPRDASLQGSKPPTPLPSSPRAFSSFLPARTRSRAEARVCRGA
jgi:hypothetical protein